MQIVTSDKLPEGSITGLNLGGSQKGSCSEMPSPTLNRVVVLTLTEGQI